MRATIELFLESSDRMIRMNPVRAKYFIRDKICLFTTGSKQEL